ncbi:hypothetical protein [Fulvimonas yonginensis]|uniref:Uncharacterized protein n=1 Tax=Fulvimonas yonginensis TaxID=1495200 RepID=A0ABU8JA12_9GAMM
MTVPPHGIAVMPSLGSALVVTLLLSGPALGQVAAPPPAAARDATAPKEGSPELRDCLPATDSRMAAARGVCLPVVGRSYSQDDLRRTGARDTAHALGRLDPSITVQGH